MELGMIGLGRMGANIVRRLLRAGHRCVAFDVHPDPVRALASEGAVGATLDAEVWLQGHVLDEHALRSRYEGVDYACSRASFWSALRRKN